MMNFLKLTFAFICLFIIIMSCKGRSIEKQSESITVTIPTGIVADSDAYFNYLFQKLSTLIENEHSEKEYFEVLADTPYLNNGLKVYVAYNKNLRRVYVDPSASCYGIYIYKDVEIERLKEKGAFRKIREGELGGYISDVFGEKANEEILNGKLNFKNIGIYHSRCKAFEN